MSQKEFLF